MSRAPGHEYTIIPPYDDPAIIAGQGTCGLEILDQPGSDAVEDALILSPVSGGGLLSGIATAVKLAAPASANVQVWARSRRMRRTSQKDVRPSIRCMKIGGSVKWLRNTRADRRA